MSFLPLSNRDVPSTIGSFRIVRLLGQGGMGVVYLGERIELFSQRVALKILHPQISIGMEDATLDHEGQILTSLDHSGIVRLLDRGEDTSGLRYIVMEYVEGMPVEEFCDLRRLPIEDRIRLLIQVMDAVEYAHRRLVIHADLKPANILITNEGQPKLLDFGIATMLDPQSLRSSNVSSMPAHYTPAFASPEQRAGERITSACDIYALGLIGSILLAGTSRSITSFTDGKETGGGAQSESLLQRLKSLDRDTLRSVAGLRATSPASLMAALGGDLDAIFSKALRSEPDQRYLSVREFANDLKAYLANRPVSARRGSHIYTARKWMQRHQIAAAMSVIFIFAVSLSAIGVVLQTAHAAKQRQIAQTRLYDLVRLTGVLEGELYDSLSRLAHAEEAKTSLLKGATDALDTLAADNGKDPALALEMARQYEKLARLQRSQSRHNGQASLDIDKGIALLQQIPGSNRNYAMAKKQIAEMQTLQAPGR